MEIQTLKRIYAMKRRYTAADLFIGHYPTGFVYANKRKEVSGDYKRVAYLNYDTLVLELEKDCPADLKALVEAHHKDVQKLRHTVYRIAGNMTTVLGRADLTISQVEQIQIAAMLK